MGSIILNNFGDLISVVEQRANIAGAVQTRDRELIKGAINEAYETIATERAWHWRKMDRDFNFNRAITTGTVAVTNGSREVVMTGITVSDQHVWRTLRFSNQRELYRIVGREVATNTFFLSANYVGPTLPTASYKMYQYEFPLPPDMDEIHMVSIDTGGINYWGTPGGELEDLNVVEFNRYLTTCSDFSGPPAFYNEDGDIPIESLPPLDVMVLDYDFLGGDQFEHVSKLRLFPIEPDVNRLVHLNYSKRVEKLIEDKDKPLIPPSDRWVLVHYALSVWHAKNNSVSMAESEMKKHENLLAEMRQKFKRTDIKPKMTIDGRRYRKYRNLYDRKLIFNMSRIGESN